MLRPIPYFEFNLIEALAALAALLALAHMLSACAKQRPPRLGLLLLALVLVFSATEATQFMTMDEAGIADLLLNPADRAFNQIMNGALGASLPLSLALTRALEVVGASSEQIRMGLKLLWWLMGAALTGLLAVLIVSIDPRYDEARPLKFLAATITLVTLPTINLGQKTFNYDLVSLGFGVAAVLLITRALLQDRPELLKLAVATAFVGAQEKLTAGPILIAAIAVLSVAGGLGVASMQRRFQRGFRTALACFALASAAGIALRGVIWLLGPTPPPSFWLSAFDAYVSWLWLPMLRFVPIETILAHRAALALAAVLGLSLGCGLAAALAPVPLRWLTTLRWRAVGPQAMAVLIVLVLGTGVAGLLAVQPYWAPFHPRLSGNVAAGQQLNQVELHTGAGSGAEHRVEMMLYAFGSLIVAIPTALWLVAFGGLVVAYVRQRSGGGAADFAVPALILSLLALPLPIVAALAGFPFGHRYFNISIGLFVAALLLCSFGLAPLLRRPLATALAVAALTGLLLAETAPFRPLFAAFRPIWLNYGDAFAPEAGRINASWMSWGEDTMLAGKLLAAKCRVGDAEIAGLRCDEIVLHTTGSGLWLPARGPIAVATVDPGLIAEKRSDFYVFNRLFLIQNLYPTPTISPSYKVSLRGYDLAWIYRADRLAASGYRFTN